MAEQKVEAAVKLEQKLKADEQKAETTVANYKASASFFEDAAACL